MATDFEAKKQEVLSRIEIRSECESMGIKFQGPTSDKGWIPCLNPFKLESNPSCGVNVATNSYRGYFCAFNMGRPSWALSFWDLCRDLHPQLSGAPWYDIFRHYAEKTGVDIGAKKTKKLPTSDTVKFYQKAITKEVRTHLHENRGLTDESIDKYEIGWSTKRERLSYPVYDCDGKLVNIRFHAWKKGQLPKTQNTKNCGVKRLWGVDRLLIDEGNTITVTEGEFDSMLIEQETGLTSVSPTNGARAFNMDWVKHFKGKHVVLVWDCDKEGREAVDKTMIPAFKGAVRRGEVLSLKVVWLFDEISKERKDFTDFMIKAGGSGKELLTLMDDAVALDFKLPTDDLPKPIVLASFKDIDDSKYAGKRVTVPVYLHGENTEAYHAPTKILVRNCPLMKKIGCHGREDWRLTCDAPIPIMNGSRIQLACIAANDFQMRGNLREFVCDRGQKPHLIIEDEDKETIREIYVHQVISGASAVTELSEKAVYVIGSRILPIGQYQATGFIRSHPKTQMPTMLIDTMEPQEEDWQAFNLDKSKHHLKKLQTATIEELLQDIQDVTKIYNRDDLHLAVLLPLCSPNWINLPGDGQIRGWNSSIIIGDSGTGKTSVSEGIFKFADIGYRVSGMTASRTGITYACDHDERRGWRIKAGALLKMSGQALIVDEAQDLPERDLKTMVDGLDTGRLKIDRIQNREFKAETRCVFSCNPKVKGRVANQRTMDSFRYGCQAVMDIFPVMMLRRIDLVSFVNSNDIKDKSDIYKFRTSAGPKFMTPENLQALFFYAWNLNLSKIKIDIETSKLIRKYAFHLSNKFGRCANLPIVCPEDFRKTFCRLSVALAVMDLSSDDDFETIKLQKKHVDYMSAHIDRIYSHENCRLDAFSEQYREEHEIEDPEELTDKIEAELGKNETTHNRICAIVKELLHLDPVGGEKIPQKYFADSLDVDRKTIQRDMNFFIKNKLVSSSRGYAPTIKLFQLSNYIDKKYPDFFKPHSEKFDENEKN